MLNFIRRSFNKGLRVLRRIKLFLVDGNHISISGKCKIDIYKDCDFIFEGKKSKLIFHGNSCFRKGFLLRICDNGIIEFGKNIFFNNYCSITCKETIVIGDDCIFGENVKIYDHNHKYNDFNIPIAQQGFSCKKVTIGKNVWIGSNVVILNGVSIGNNSIIGAGCIVYKDIPENHIMLSNGIIKEIKRG